VELKKIFKGMLLFFTILVISMSIETKALAKEFTDVPIDKEWHVKFSKTIKKKSISYKKIYILDDEREKHSCDISIDSDKRTLVIKPSKDLSNGKNYSLVIESLRADDGSILRNQFKQDFSTEKLKRRSKVWDERELIYSLQRGDEIVIRDDRLQETYDAAKKIIEEVVDEGMTEYEKEMAIHDYIVLNCEYDYDNYLNGCIPMDSYEAYGVLINKTAVCSGYANATAILMNMAGLECKCINGNVSTDGHAWNIIKIDGEYYQLDTTWDDPVPDRKGYVRHKYFNLNDESLWLDSGRTWYIEDTKCDGFKYNYSYFEYCKEKEIDIDDYVELNFEIKLPREIRSYNRIGQIVVREKGSRYSQTLNLYGDYNDDVITKNIKLPSSEVDEVYEYSIYFAENSNYKNVDGELDLKNGSSNCEIQIELN
jgi:hypothetical protein